MNNTMTKIEWEMMKYVEEQISRAVRDDDDYEEIEMSSDCDDFRYIINSKDISLSTSDQWLAMLTVAYLNKREFDKNN